MTLNIEMRLDALEKAVAEMRAVWASVAGKLLAADAIAPDKPKRATKKAS